MIELIKKSIENKDIDKNIYIILTPETKTILLSIISQTPETLIDLEKLFVDVIKDDKIDSNDIPQLIILVQSLYKVIYTLKKIKLNTKKRTAITCNLLKYIINILITEEIIMINKENLSNFNIQMNILIDSCMSLISLSKSLKSASCLNILLG